MKRRFSEFLIEGVLNEKAIPLTDVSIEKNGMNFLAWFKVGDIKIIFEAVNTMFDEDEMIDMSELTFTYELADGTRGRDLLNIGVKFGRTVIDTIVMLIRYYVDRHAPSIIYFNATGRGRIAVYNRASKELTLNGYRDISQEVKEYNGKPVKNYYFINKFLYNKKIVSRLR